MVKRNRLPGGSFLRLAVAAVLISGLCAVAAPAALAGHKKARARGCEVRHHHPRVHHPRHHRHVAKRWLRHHRDAHAAYYPVWCRGPEWILMHQSRPYYLHAGFGIYFGGAAIEIDVSDAPPRGYAYLDPYCDRGFGTVSEYRRHLRHHRHPHLIEVALVGGGGCGPGFWTVR